MPLLDVYRDWLEIAEPARPLNHYQLLKLKPFEDDTALIRSQYRKFNALVRTYSGGEFQNQSQDLLNELAKSMLVLTDATRKSEYDVSLGRSDQGDGKRRSLEQILVGRKVLDSAALDKARRYAKTVSVDIRDAVMQLKLAKPDLLMQAYAESVGFAYVDLADVGVDETLVPKVPAVLARQHSLVPLREDDGLILVASPNPISPEVEDQLRLRFGKPTRGVLCTPTGVNEAIGKYYPKEAAVAQMSAVSAAPKPAASKAEKKEAPRVERNALSPDQREMVQRERRLMIIACGPATIAVYGILGSIFGWIHTQGAFFYLIAISLGLVAMLFAYLASKVLG